jgi:hypothetical protein
MRTRSQARTPRSKRAGPNLASPQRAFGYGERVSVPATVSTKQRDTVAVLRPHGDRAPAFSASALPGGNAPVGPAGDRPLLHPSWKASGHRALGSASEDG